MRDCKVNHLHLKTSDPDAARHTALLVEDGLRTASFPDEGGRLVMVRSLALGRIGHHASALTVSMQIEQALRRLPSQLVHAASAAAATASAIYFRDETEAFTLFALQLARGISPSAWFWQRLIPGYRPGQSDAEGYRLLLQAILARAEGTLLLLRLVERLVEAGSVDPLLALLQPQDGPLLLRRYGWQPPSTPEAASVLQPMRHKLAFVTLLRTWGQRWEGHDLRTLWLANLLSAIEQPLWLNDPRLSEQSQAWITQMMTRVRNSAEGASKTSSNTREVVSESEREHTGLPQPVTEQEQPPDSSSLTSASAQFLHEDDEDSVAQRDDLAQTTRHNPEPSSFAAAINEAVLPADERWELGLQPTVAGGLFFLLNALTRLHFGEWLLTAGQTITDDFASHLLRTICHQLAIAADDPIWSALVVDADQTANANEDLLRLCTDWSARLSAWCNDVAELDLATIVQRSARLYATPTHIDLTFDLNQVDLRIRRIGLDFDPGWVAWLGRVVMFHYR